MMSKILCLIFVAIASAQEWETPDYCRTIDCPVFEILEKAQDWELRRYEAAQYVSTDFTASSQQEFDRENSNAFNRLFGYIDGGNADGVIIEMTAPVVDKVLPLVNGTSSITQSFYIPYEYQGIAPAPTGEGVYLQDFPELTVYVSNFTDYAFLPDHVDNINQMKANLDATYDTIVYSEEEQYWCGYDSPFQPFDRHNEGWLEAL